jgi:Zn-dependent protease
MALAIQIAVLLVSLSVHESAHAWVANRLGDPTARYLGRVTLNPLVHIDPVGSLLFPLLGLLFGGVVFGWAKPVPVNPRNLANPMRDHAIVAAAGPASNIVLALLFLVFLKLLGFLGEGGWLYPLFLLCYFGLLLNTVLAVFNLLPLPPLDGGWILTGVLPKLAGPVFELIRPYSFVVLILLLYSGVISTILNPVLAFVRQLAL